MRVYSLLIVLGILIMGLGTVFIALSASQGDWLLYIFPFIILGGSELSWVYFIVPMLFFVIMLSALNFMNRLFSKQAQIVQSYPPRNTDYDDAQHRILQTCMECGRNIPSDAVYCPYCGSRLTHEGTL